MAPKQSKKTLWLECEHCGCNIPSSDKNIHLELKCAKEQMKCPYMQDGKLHTYLQRGSAPPDGAPRDSVLLHPTTASLLGAVIGAPVELTRLGAPKLVKRVWPSRSSAAAAVILPAAGNYRYIEDISLMCKLKLLHF